MPNIFSYDNPLDHPHWYTLSSEYQLTPVSRSQTALFGMPHLTSGTNFLLLFVFLISSILHYHPALLHHQALVLDRLLTFLVAFSILILKSFVKVIPSTATVSLLCDCQSVL